ncbi:MAG: hypothetical protein JNL21_07455 [Myxococcales bacterium]|nr:hypothetical protein [Myxococcales bacterium]
MRLLSTWTALVLLGLVTRTARAQDAALGATAQRCVSDHEAAQVKNAEGSLRAALELARSCALPACPDLVRGYCAKLADEYETQLPKISVRARGPDGCDTTDARVSVDGVLVSERSDGQAVALDPGKRVISVELAGAPREEQTIVAARGESLRTLRFGEERAERCGARPGMGKPAEPARPSPGSTGLSAATIAGIVVGSVSLASLATSGALGVVGLVERSDLEACRPCTQEEVDDVRRFFIVGDVFLGVGGAAAITSIVLLVVGAQEPAGPSTASAALRIDVGPFGLGLEGRF